MTILSYSVSGKKKKKKITHRLPPKYISINQYKKLNSDQFIYDLVSNNWNRVELTPSVDDAWKSFYSEVSNVILYRYLMPSTNISQEFVLILPLIFLNLST